MNAIRIIVWIFGLWVLYQIIIKYRDKKLTFGGLILWIVVWVGIIGFVSQAPVADEIAEFIGLGQGRGIELSLFLAILFILYLIFRFYIKITEIETQISEVVKHIAVMSAKKGRAKKGRGKKRRK